jgi:hypothetical protein
MQRHLYSLSVLFALATGFGYVAPGNAAPAGDPCGGCFIVGDWYWNNTPMTYPEILDWMALCLEVNDC